MRSREQAEMHRKTEKRNFRKIYRTIPIMHVRAEGERRSIMRGNLRNRRRSFCSVIKEPI